MKTTALDRIIAWLDPARGTARLRERLALTVAQRHFDAASTGRRTIGWRRKSTDANQANLANLSVLRDYARDLERNNPWARRGLRIAANNAIMWGIVPKPAGGKAATKKARLLWHGDPKATGKRGWANSTACDYDGRHTYYGLQRLAFGTMAAAGACLVRRHWRPTGYEGMTIPLQLQILEPDFIDIRKDGIQGTHGGPIIQGIEFDARGRRAGYWLYDNHPGALGQGPRYSTQSRFVDAADIVHIYRVDRPGQVHGISWLAPVIVTLNDFDELEDATLMRQKIAACFAGVVTDTQGATTGLGDNDDSEDYETVEPGTMMHLPVGKDVKFSDPPSTSDYASYSPTQLRKIAVGLGITYAQLSGDYSQYNFASSKLERIEFAQNLHEWRWEIMIPQFCDVTWKWAMEAAAVAGLISEVPGAEWTPPPMPMAEPDKEWGAYKLAIRAGGMTPDEMIREQGGDPETHWQEYADALKRFDELGIILDIDARKVSGAGLAQAAVGGGKNAANSQGEKPDAPEDEQDGEK